MSAENVYSYLPVREDYTPPVGAECDPGAYPARGLYLVGGRVIVVTDASVCELAALRPFLSVFVDRRKGEWMEARGSDAARRWAWFKRLLNVKMKLRR